MATTHPPWKVMNFKTPMALFYHVASTTDPPPIDTYALSLPLRGIILRCFERDPEKRAHAAELLGDPFLAEFREDESDDLSHSDPLNNTVSRIERVATPATAPSPHRGAPPGNAGNGGGNLSSLKMRMSLRASTGAS